MLDIQVKKLSRQLSIDWRPILMIVLIALLFSLQACTVHKRGATTPDRVVEQYLLALENKDEQLMLQLAHEDAVIPREITAKIVNIGGSQIQDRQIVYTKSTPVVWNAKIKGIYVDRFGIHRNFDDAISIGYQSKGQVKLYGGRWYLLLENRGSVTGK